MKIGLFGGSFNPPHNGHVNAIQMVKKKLGLDLVYVVPNFQNPLKAPTEGPTAAQRLEMTQLAFQGLDKDIVVSDIEINRNGPSYTIETLLEIKKLHPKAELFLILGLDLLEEINLWKDYKGILAQANLILTSRPGLHIPENREELPGFIKEFILDYEFNIIELTTGKRIEFISLKDIEASSTDIRKLLRIGKAVEKFLPLNVESYIKANGLYKNLGHKIGDFNKFSMFCAQQLENKKALQLRAFDLSQLSAPTEFTIICSGTSTRHTTSLGETLIQAVKEEYNVYPQSTEGADTGRWVVIDYGSLMIHIFYDFIRQEYGLEKLWKNGVEIPLKPSPSPIK